MASIHAISFSIQSALQAATTGPICDLETSAIESPSVTAIEYSQVGDTAAGVPRIGLGRASNTPVGLFKYPFVPEDPTSQVSTSGVYVGWTVAPTVPANLFRSVYTSSAAIAFIIWTFPRGLKVPVSSSLVMWGAGLGAPSLGNVSWEIEV